MAVSSDAPPAAEPSAATMGGDEPTMSTGAACDFPADDDKVNPVNFAGSVRTNNKLPSQATLRRIADLPVLDREGKAQPFKSLYEAQPGRTLVLFVRHFFCGVRVRPAGPYPVLLDLC